MAKIVSFINQKGGVGKTTTTFQFASFLTKQGKKVLCIDLDAQGNLTLALNVNTDGKYIVGELMLNKEGATFEETVIKTNYCDLLPSDDNMTFLEYEINSKLGREKLLHKAIKPYIDNYDYVLIDCPPSANTLVYNAITVSTDIVLVATPTAFSVQGILKLISKITDFGNDVLDRKVHIAGILINQYQSSDYSDGFEELTRQISDKCGIRCYENKIHKYFVVEECQSQNKSIFDYAPKGKSKQESKKKVYEQYCSAFNEIINSLEG